MVLLQVRVGANEGQVVEVIESLVGLVVPATVCSIVSYDLSGCLHIIVW